MESEPTREAPTDSRRREWLVVAVAGAAVAAVGVFTALVHLGVASYFERNGSDRTDIVWEDLGPTPKGGMGYTPQGLAIANGRLLLAECWRDTKSRVYEFDPESLAILRHFDMPAEAVHTSGLAWDGEVLWAVDHATNLAYGLDLEKSFAAGRAQVVGRFDTTLAGTSACCMVPWKGERLLAISDFMNSRRTILVEPREAMNRGTAAESIRFAYRNEGFSQGLVFANGFLYEAENKLGIDVVNQLDPARLAETGSAHHATVGRLHAPERGVEDLAWDGERIWTSDEVVFRLYRGTLPR